MKKPTVKQIPIETVVEDFNLYPRHSVDSTTVNHYAESLRAGAGFPPIRVDAKSMRVIDGFHRLGAHRRAGYTEILAQIEEARDEADLFERAVAANGAHGHRYTTFDYARILTRAKELGLEREKVAGALQITPVRLEEIERGNFGRSETQAAVPLKRTIAHMSDRQLTPGQVEANDKLGGMKQTFYVNQVILLIENDLIDRDDAGLLQRLDTLRGLLVGLDLKAAA